MSYRIVTDPASRCIAVVWRGTVTLETVRDFMAAIAALPLFPDRRSVLHDLSADVDLAGDDG